MSSQSFRSRVEREYDALRSPTTLAAMSMLAKIRAVTRDRHVKAPVHDCHVVKATIRDLNGNAVSHHDPTHPKLILRRAASGHLFQPSGVGSAVEMLASITVSRDPILYQAREGLGIIKPEEAADIITVTNQERVEENWRRREKKVRFQLPDESCA